MPVDKEHMIECRTREFGVNTKKRSLVAGVSHEGVSLYDLLTSELYISKF
jgi:hypothetical protein